MQDKIMQVFYGSDRLPYKDIQRQVHYPNVGSVITGENNTTKVRFYITQIGGSDRLWVANIVTQSGRHYNRVLSNVLVDEEEQYVELDIADLYASEVGRINIGLQGYAGDVNVVEISEGHYEINGTPTILATGNILIIANYTPNTIREEMLDPTLIQEILSAINERLYPYDDNTILKYDSLEQAQADISRLVENQVIMVKLPNGKYLNYTKRNGALQIAYFEDNGTGFVPMDRKVADIPLARDISVDELIQKLGAYASISVMPIFPTQTISRYNFSTFSATYIDEENGQALATPYFVIKRNGNDCSLNDAKDWLRRVTGNNVVPTYNYEKPQSELILFRATQDYGSTITKDNLVLVKAQYDTTSSKLFCYLVDQANKTGEINITNNYGGLTIKNGGGHDIRFINNETKSTFAIYRGNTNEIIMYSNIKPGADNTYEMGVLDQATPTNNRGFKHIVATKFAISSKWVISSDSSGNLTFTSLTNGQNLLTMSVNNGYIYTRGIFPITNKNRPLGGDESEFQEVWTPTLKTKDGGTTYTKEVKNLATIGTSGNVYDKTQTYTKGEVDSLISALTGVTHKYQHNIHLENEDDDKTCINFSFINDVSTEYTSKDDIGSAIRTIYGLGNDVSATGRDLDNTFIYSIYTLHQLNKDLLKYKSGGNMNNISNFQIITDTVVQIY